MPPTESAGRAASPLPRRRRPPSRAFLALALLAVPVLGGPGVAAELFLFRGDFIYIIPRVLSDEMSRLAGRGEWKHFPQHTRYLDLDGDGVDGFVAAAFGVSTGHGAQVRCRPGRTPDRSVRLGRWYRSVITDPHGAALFARFSP